MSVTEETAILREMLALADRLGTTSDELLAGQYAYLRSRIEALLELQGAGRAP